MKKTLYHHTKQAVSPNFTESTKTSILGHRLRLIVIFTYFPNRLISYQCFLHVFLPFFCRLLNDMVPARVFFCCKPAMTASKLQYNPAKSHQSSVIFQALYPFLQKKIGYQYPVSNLLTENDHFLLCIFSCNLFAKSHVLP